MCILYFCDPVFIIFHKEIQSGHLAPLMTNYVFCIWKGKLISHWWSTSKGFLACANHWSGRTRRMPLNRSQQWWLITTLSNLTMAIVGTMRFLQVKWLKMPRVDQAKVGECNSTMSANSNHSNVPIGDVWKHLAEHTINNITEYIV